MKDVFVEADESMSRATDSQVPPSPADSFPDGHICPFCGLTRELTDDFDASTPCPRCTLADTATTRNATRARIGPWYVRQVRNPWAPGMRFETLLALVKRGQVTKDSIVRGPTTHQLWKRASEIKGLSREFGVCHSCGAEIDQAASLCPHCNRLQEPPANPDVLVEGREMLATRENAPARESSPAREDVRARESAPTRDDLRGRENAAARDDARPRENGGARQNQPAAPVVPPPMNEPRRNSRSAPTPQPAPAPKPQTARAAKTQAVDDDGPATLDIGALVPPVSDDMLEVTDDAAALARELTARPPAKPRSMRPLDATAPDDALLTPQELAQAFQLNFTPEKTARRTSKRAVAVVLLLLIAAGAAVVFYLRPDYRTTAVQWSNEKWSAVKTFVASRTAPAASTSPRHRELAAEPTTQAKQQPIVIAPAPVEPAPKPTAVEPPVKNESAQTEATVTHEPIATPPAPVSEPAAVKAPEPAIVEPVMPPAPVAPPPAPVAVAPAPAPVTPVPSPEVNKSTAATQLPSGTPEEQALELWRRAIDAEGKNQDYVEAVRCYELIKTLPEDVQPKGLDVRLELAKKNLPK